MKNDRPNYSGGGGNKGICRGQGIYRAGKSIEDTFQVVARWQGHASDVLYASQRHQKQKNPLKTLVFQDQ